MGYIYDINKAKENYDFFFFYFIAMYSLGSIFPLDYLSI